MGFDVEIEELNDFLIHTCEIEALVLGAKDPVTGKDSQTFVNVPDDDTGLSTHPCRREPAVLNSRPEDRKFVKNTLLVKATHRLWLRKEVSIVETDNRIFNINGNGFYYDILFVENFPNELGTQTKELVLSQIRN